MLPALSEDRPFQWHSPDQLDELFRRYSILSRREVRLQARGLKYDKAKLARLEIKLAVIDKERDLR